MWKVLAASLYPILPDTTAATALAMSSSFQDWRPLILSYLLTIALSERVVQDRVGSREGAGGGEQAAGQRAAGAGSGSAGGVRAG